MPVNPDAPGFSPGAHPSRADTRDYRYAQIASGSAPFDWDKGYDVEDDLGVKLKPKDQGNSSSCGGQAWSMAAAILEAAASKSFEERSAKFIYSQTFVPGGGSGGRENSIIYKNQGCAVEALLPSYEGGKPPTEAFMRRSQDITKVIRANASMDKALSYSTVALDIDAIAQALRDNKTVLVGVDGSNNGTWLSSFPKPPKNGEHIWRHWVCVVKAKLVKGVKHLGIINSWGPSAGENGIQWLSEGYVNSMIHDADLNINQQAIWEAWTITHPVSVPDPVPAPVPTPVPPSFTHTFTTTLKLGQTNAEVKALQDALRISGVFPAGQKSTGYYGPITQTAVMAFQRKYQVASEAEIKSVNGLSVGPKTRTKLNELYSK